MVAGAIRSVMGAFQSGYRRVVPTRWRGHDWSAPPLLPGKWRKVAPDAAMTLMIRLCAQVPEAAAICATHDITALRQRRLISIKDGLLIEFQAAPHDGGTRGIGALIYRPGLFDLLNGRAIILHQLRWDEAVVLDTKEQALEFAQLFCGAMQGEDGCFFPMRRGMPNRMNRHHPQFWSSLHRLAMPPEVRRNGDQWEIDLAYAYGSGFYRSRLTLNASSREFGMIEMVDDDHLCGIAPASAVGWEGVLRFNYRVAPEAIANPCTACADEEDSERPSHAQ